MGDTQPGSHRGDMCKIALMGRCGPSVFALPGTEMSSPLLVVLDGKVQNER